MLLTNHEALKIWSAIKCFEFPDPNFRMVFGIERDGYEAQVRVSNNGVITVTTCSWPENEEQYYSKEHFKLAYGL